MPWQEDTSWSKEYKAMKFCRREDFFVIIQKPAEKLGNPQLTGWLIFNASILVRKCWIWTFFSKFFLFQLVESLIKILFYFYYYRYTYFIGFVSWAWSTYNDLTRTTIADIIHVKLDKINLCQNTETYRTAADLKACEFIEEENMWF